MNTSLIRPRLRFRALIIVLLALALTATACGSGDGASSSAPDGTDETSAPDVSSTPAGNDDPLKIAFVYFGPIGDEGWTYSHEQSRQAVIEEFGDRVETSYVENVPEGPESERVIEDLARKGHDVIVGTAVGYSDQMLAVAEKFPDTIFINATGYTRAPNLGTYMVALDQVRYLEGMAAGFAAENDKIGFVAAFPTQEVLRHINGYTLGAQSVNPDVEVQLVWTSTWYDPALERQAAESLVSAGVDVISTYQDTPAQGQVADEHGVKWTGFGTDMKRFGPEGYLTGGLWNWSAILVDQIQNVLDGTWESEDIYASLSDNAMKLAPFGDSVPEDQREIILQKEEEIRANGTEDIYAGPIYKQDGSIAVPEGETMSLEMQRSTDFLVKGVIGELPAEITE